MSTVSDTVHPSTLDQIQANIVDWFEGISKGVELPIRFSHPSESSNRLCLFSTPTTDFKVQVDQRTILLQVKRHRLSVVLDKFDVRTEFRDRRDRFRDDYHVKKKRATEAAASRNEGDQLRTVDQIQKLRLQKEQKKKKNARPTKKRK